MSHHTLKNFTFRATLPPSLAARPPPPPPPPMSRDGSPPPPRPGSPRRPPGPPRASSSSPSRTPAGDEGGSGVRGDAPVPRERPRPAPHVVPASSFSRDDRGGAECGAAPRAREPPPRPDPTRTHADPRRPDASPSDRTRVRSSWRDFFGRGENIFRLIFYIRIKNPPTPTSPLLRPPQWHWTEALTTGISAPLGAADEAEPSATPRGSTPPKRRSAANSSPRSLPAFPRPRRRRGRLPLRRRVAPRRRRGRRGRRRGRRRGDGRRREAGRGEPRRGVRPGVHDERVRAPVPMPRRRLELESGNLRKRPGRRRDFLSRRVRRRRRGRPGAPVTRRREREGRERERDGERETSL